MMTSLDQLIKNWNMGDVSAIEALPSFWGKTRLVKFTDGREFVLKEKTDLHQIEQEANLLVSLAKAGAPVAVPIPVADGTHYATSAGKLFCLYPKLSGKVIAEHYDDNAMVQAKMFGRAIAFLHTCFQQNDHLDSYKDMKLMEQIQEWAIPCVRKHRDVVDGDMVERIWRSVEQEIISLYLKPPSQLIHRDLNPANMLFDQGKLTGFVDFDMVVRGPRIFDVCYCGSSILVGGFQDAAKVKRWPEIFRALVKDYQNVCPLTSAEQLALYGILVTIQLLFMAFSLETRAEGAAKCNASVLKWLSANRESIVV